MTPPPDLLRRLRGPRPPDHFRSDGCSGVPDWWVRLACWYHDYAYQVIRNTEGVSKGYRKTMRRVADLDFRKNIRISSRWHLVNGVLVKRKWHSRRIPAVVLAFAYWAGVRVFGSRAVRRSG